MVSLVSGKCGVVGKGTGQSHLLRLSTLSLGRASPLNSEGNSPSRLLFRFNLVRLGSLGSLGTLVIWGGEGRGGEGRAFLRACSFKNYTTHTCLQIFTDFRFRIFLHISQKVDASDYDI